LKIKITGANEYLSEYLIASDN